MRHDWYCAWCGQPFHGRAHYRDGRIFHHALDKECLAQYEADKAHQAARQYLDEFERHHHEEEE